jgi:hypothetical protein
MTLMSLLGTHLIEQQILLCKIKHVFKAQSTAITAVEVQVETVTEEKLDKTYWQLVD